MIFSSKFFIELFFLKKSYSKNMHAENEVEVRERVV